MSIPYRAQRAIKRIFTAVLVTAILMAAGTACWLIWIQRYIVYTADGGAKLDFNLPPLKPGESAVAPEKWDISINYDKSDEIVDVSTELTQMAGYYVEPDALKDLATVKAQIEALPAGTPVLVDVKNISGYFYYSSSVSSARSKQVDIAAMDDLIAFLKRSNVYAIARFPALRDYTYGLNHVSDGVHHESGRYLYLDESRCYWLHPGSQGTLSYLTQIILELKSLGCDEVVLDDFRFPEATNILVKGDKAELLTNAANTLVSACATDRFAISFVKSSPFTPPSGRSRIYLSGMDASQAANAAQNSGVANPVVNLVFLTEIHDTRFDAYSVLRPLSGAH